MPNDRYRIHTLLLGAAVLIFLGVYGIGVCKHSAYNPKTQKGTDFTAFYSAGEQILHGKNLYEYLESSVPFRPYIYPPMFAVFPMTPLALLPHDAAATVFFIINLLLLGGGLWLVWKVLAPPLLGAGTGEGEDLSRLSFFRRREFGCFVALAVCWRFVNNNLRNGQANLYIFFCLALALYFLVKRAQAPAPDSAIEITAQLPIPNPRHREILGGILVALATTFKLTPGLFGVYFFWTFRRWAMVGGALGLALFLFVIPSAVLGVHENWRCLHSWSDHFRNMAVADEETPLPETEILIGRPKKAPAPANLPRADGISLRGTLLKLLSPTEAIDPGESGGPHNVNVVNLDLKQAQTVANAFALLLLLVTVALTVPRWTRDGAMPLALSWSLTTIAMALIAPLTRAAHLVVLLIPVSVLIALLQQNRVNGSAKALAWLSLATLALAGPLTSQAIIGDRANQLVQAYGETTWSMLLMYIALAAALRQQKPDSPGTPIS